MTPERWQQVKNIFDGAVESRPASRMAYIRDRCGDDDELRREVESLLASDMQTGSLLDNPLMETGPVVPAPANPGADPLSHNDSFGPYEPVRVLGEGGMGTVYLARQQQPIRREVALKVVKLGMDSRQVLERFENERQSLALMSHPNIAQVFDAGISEGRPYFVMEYVNGISITEYCDQNRLSNTERMELFISVCRAIQHAHQKGVIHRDIKPSNVLVSIQDGKPIPKVIDFGVAKATNQSLAVQTFFTEQGLLIGTPEYMSPEQVAGENVDTTTDIYSLGTLLYELLVGALPFDPQVLRGAGYDAMKRLIREGETPLPAARLRSLGAKTAEIAMRRRTDPQALERQLRGDLSWITTRAMEKERTRRYASASELAADIERHLHYEPVEARPPRALYRASKFVRKHRGAVAGTLIVSVALLAFLGLTIAVDLANEIQRQFQSDLDRADTINNVATIMVIQAVNRNRTTPLRDVLRDPDMPGLLLRMLVNAPSILEIAVVDPQNNEILLDSDPHRLGTILPPYPDFRPLVVSTSWYVKLRLLLGLTGSFLLEQPYFQLERLLQTAERRSVISVRSIIAPVLIRQNLKPTLARSADEVILFVILPGCLMVLLTIALLRFGR
jgi:serine/threonine-protein kinase